MAKKTELIICLNRAFTETMEALKDVCVWMLR